MPISAENMAKYPGGSIRSREWLAIRKRILAREEHACKWCGAPNGAVIARIKGGDAYGLLTYRDGDPVMQVHDAETGALQEVVEMDPGGDFPGVTDVDYRDVKVVLTIAHLDHDVTQNHDANLAALCQRCHNRHDSEHRRANAARTRRARLASADLFDAMLEARDR